MACDDIIGSGLLLELYLVTQAVTGACIGDVTAANDSEIIKIVSLILVFVIFRAVFVGVILALVSAHASYTINVKYRHSIVRNYLSRRMLENEDSQDYQILNYFLNEAVPETHVRNLDVSATAYC